MTSSSTEEDFIVLDESCLSSDTGSNEGEDDGKSWFSQLASLSGIVSNPNPKSFVSRITGSIQNITKLAPKGKIEKNTLFDHELHLFDTNTNVFPNVKEFCAEAFRDLRENLYLIPREEYILEWTLTEDQLQASEGAGRSGSLFAQSRTKRFMFKTIFKSEVDSLISMIKRYHKYCHEQPDTLIMKMLGLYCFTDDSLSTSFTYVLVFANVTWSGESNPLKIHQIFDLKGRRTKVI